VEEIEKSAAADKEDGIKSSQNEWPRWVNELL
jgi:hypothetical protein